MATAALIPVAEYLATMYRPDRDYVDGEVIERHLGEMEHGALQAFLGGMFVQHEIEWHLDGFLGVRMEIGPTRYRVPDLCARRPDGPPGPSSSRRR